MSDNELDNLFKEAADGFKAPNDPSAWQDMSRKLDQATTTTTYWNWKTITSVTGIVVTSVALVWYLSSPGLPAESVAASHVTLNQASDKKSSDNKTIVFDPQTNASSQDLESNIDVIEENDQNRNNAQGIIKRDNSISSTKSNKAASTENFEKNQRTQSSQNDLIIEREHSNDALAIERTDNSTQSTETKRSIAPAENSGEVQNGSSSQQRLQEQNQSGQQMNNPESIQDKVMSLENKTSGAEVIAGVAVTEEISGSKSSDGTLLNESNSRQTSKASGPAVQTESASVAVDSLKKIEEEKKTEPANSLISKSDRKPEKDKPTSINKFAVKLVFAPDYTTVKSATPKSMGVNYGALFEYRLSEHWSVATGGIWSKKIYSANDVEYSGYKADWVDGDCRMWDIPINVYYNFSSRKPFSFYAGLGFSSYLMNEENYVYYVETPYGTYDYPKQVKGKNNEWFKTLNVSAGIQFRMSQRFSLQFEPTLKAPLAGVGEGEVSLVSLGAFFNLRYQIPVHKTTKNDR